MQKRRLFPSKGTWVPTVAGWLKIKNIPRNILSTLWLQKNRPLIKRFLFQGTDIICGSGSISQFFSQCSKFLLDFLRQSHNLPNPQNNHLFLCGIFLSRPFSNRTEGASFSVHAPGVHRYFDVLPFTPVFQSDREGFFLCPCAGRAPLLRCSTFHARAHKKKSETYWYVSDRYKQGYKDSNLEMLESESSALPFGDSPMFSWSFPDHESYYNTSGEKMQALF